MKSYVKKQFIRFRVYLIFDAYKRTKYIVKKNIFKNDESERCNFYINRDFFMKFWKEISDYELIISASFFRKKLGVNYKMFTCIVDSTQRVKGVKGSYYKLSYVNKVLKENNLPLL